MWLVLVGFLGVRLIGMRPCQIRSNGFLSRQRLLPMSPDSLDEYVEVRLLLKETCSSWFGRFSFQSEMNAFVTAVLLGMARFDALHANA